jgi:hypothetical protein
MSRKARRGIFNRGLSKYVSAQFGQAQDDSQTQPFCKAGPDMILVCSGTRVVRNLLEVLSANPFGHISRDSVFAKPVWTHLLVRSDTLHKNSLPTHWLTWSDL